MWRTEWNAISARISGLLEAGEVYFKVFPLHEDNYGVTNILLNNVGQTVFMILRFKNQYSEQLAEGPKVCLGHFLRDHQSRFSSADENDPFGNASGASGVAAVLTSLASFRTEFEYLISDTEALARSLVVRAFAHLQRSIVADTRLREIWRTALERGETVCEALGACHLLLHGIWAFKAVGIGERTDLVLQEPFQFTDEVSVASQGVVLTEWKVAHDQVDATRQAERAYEQIKRYSQGLLGGLEVTSVRYIVVVSEDHLTMPEKRRESGVDYEFRNIAVSPSVPSRARAKHP